MIEHAGDRVLYATESDVPWNRDVDVVVVGSGGAGWAAAIAAAEMGVKVIVLEKSDRIGGTTAQAGGGGNYRASTWLWICNHPWLAALGVEDPRDDAVRYMARLARPNLYRADHPTLGLQHDELNLIQVFYDHGRVAVKGLTASGALDLAPLEHINDYYADLGENATPRGRALYLRNPDGTEGTGADIIASMSAAAGSLGVETRTSLPVRGVVVDETTREVLGVTAGSTAADAALIRAHGGVVFATGGFAHDEDLVRNYLRGPVLGGMAAATNEGDLVRIATAVGARLHCMNEAWFAPIILDQAPNPPSGAFRLPGDSMIVVNLQGERVANEKTAYNEFTRTFFAWDPARAEYRNLPLVMLYDESVSERCRDMPEDAPVAEGGGNPLPRTPLGEPHELTGHSWTELAEQIALHLDKYRDTLPLATLVPDFVDRLTATIERFDDDAATGVDRDFGRGGTTTERARSGAPRPSPCPNPTMHPFRDCGPYYAVILVPGVLDTKGGPAIDGDARLLDLDGRPITGLYGAGNCVSSPAGQAYWAGGTTLGLAVTFGWIAGRHAAQRAAHLGSAN